MTEPSLPELEAERDRLYAQLSTAGDFRRGSVSENYRKCGRPNCACAAADHRGHGPRFLWTRSAGSRKTVGRQLAAAEVEKVRREIARYAEFTAAVEQIVESSVMGTPMVALCGKVWVPSRDPKRYPVCPTCKEIYEQLPPGDGGED